MTATPRGDAAQELQQLVPAMTEMAREAGALLMSYFGRVAIEYKDAGSVDIVTAADRAAEALIVKRIHAAFPGHEIVGEEGTRELSGSAYRWYVDPLDGTTNFAHGYPVFCVSLGVERDGELVAGVIFDPTRNELFSAEKGKGAFRNGAPIAVSKDAALGKSLVATGFPSVKRHQNPNIHFYHEITLQTHGIRRAGSAALDLANVACGRFGAFWEFNLNPWDTAAGVLLVREAGGRVTDFRGGPFQISSVEVLASNGSLHDELLEVFERVFEGRELAELPSVADYLKARKLP